jgi:hypothetical protein
VIGAESYGPMTMVVMQPGFFWYGIHSVDMLFAILDEGCRQVIGLSAQHGKGDLLKAILEGNAYQMEGIPPQRRSS